MTIVVLMCLLLGVAIGPLKGLWVTGPLMVIILALWIYGRYLPTSDADTHGPTTELPTILDVRAETTAPSAPAQPPTSVPMTLAVVLACTVGAVFMLIVIGYIDLASHPG